MWGCVYVATAQLGSIDLFVYLTCNLTLFYCTNFYFFKYYSVYLIIINSLGIFPCGLYTNCVDADWD